MPELEPCRVRRPAAEETGRDRRSQAVGEVGGFEPKRGAHQPVVQAATRNRSSPNDASGRGRQTPEPGRQDIAQTGRQVCPAMRPRGDQLLDEERVPVRTLEHPVDHVRRWRRAG